MQIEGCRTAAEINNDGGRAHFFQCDVSDPQSLRACAKRIYASPELGDLFNSCCQKMEILTQKIGPICAFEI